MSPAPSSSGAPNVVGKPIKLDFTNDFLANHLGALLSRHPEPIGTSEEAVADDGSDGSPRQRGSAMWRAGEETGEARMAESSFACRPWPVPAWDARVGRSISSSLQGRSEAESGGDWIWEHENRGQASHRADDPLNVAAETSAKRGELSHWQAQPDRSALRKLFDASQVQPRQSRGRGRLLVKSDQGNGRFRSPGKRRDKDNGKSRLTLWAEDVSASTRFNLGPSSLWAHIDPPRVGSEPSFADKDEPGHDSQSGQLVSPWSPFSDHFDRSLGLGGGTTSGSGPETAFPVRRYSLSDIDRDTAPGPSKTREALMHRQQNFAAEMANNVQEGGDGLHAREAMTSQASDSSGERQSASHVNVRGTLARRPTLVSISSDGRSFRFVDIPRNGVEGAEPESGVVGTEDTERRESPAACASPDAGGPIEGQPPDHASHSASSSAPSKNRFTFGERSSGFSISFGSHRTGSHHSSKPSQGTDSSKARRRQIHSDGKSSHSGGAAGQGSQRSHDPAAGSKLARPLLHRRNHSQLSLDFPQSVSQSPTHHEAEPVETSASDSVCFRPGPKDEDVGEGDETRPGAMPAGSGVHSISTPLESIPDCQTSADSSSSKPASPWTADSHVRDCHDLSPSTEVEPAELTRSKSETAKDTTTESEHDLEGPT